MEYTLLKDINQNSQQWTIKVRVTRFTDYFSPDNPAAVSRIDVVLLDEQGNAMEGVIPENRLAVLRARLNEDSIYYIQYFHVCDARQKYRPVDHPCMMRFTVHTKVYDVTVIPPTFPRYACTVASYQTLRTRIGNRDFCSDIVGIFTGCSQIRSQNTRNGAKPLREVYLTDGREDIVITLWDHHAQRFDADHYMDVGTQTKIVFLFVGITCLIYNNKLSLQSASSCRWYMNPELPEVAALQNSCAGRTTPPSWSGAASNQAVAQRITFAELTKFDNPHVIFNNKYIVEATIKSLIPGRQWWYPACKTCHKAAPTESDMFICRNKNCTGTESGPRYRLAMTAVDPLAAQTEQGSSTIEIVIFGPKAQELIGVPVDWLISSTAGVADYIPPQITGLYGKGFEMRISVSPYSLQSETIIYQVDAILQTLNIPVLPQLPSATVQKIDLLTKTNNDTPVSEDIPLQTEPSSTQKNMTADQQTFLNNDNHAIQVPAVKNADNDALPYTDKTAVEENTAVLLKINDDSHTAFKVAPNQADLGSSQSPPTSVSAKITAASDASPKMTPPFNAVFLAQDESPYKGGRKRSTTDDSENSQISKRPRGSRNAAKAKRRLDLEESSDQDEE